MGSFEDARDKFFSPSVSIVLPCRNRGKYLAKTLGSFEAQNYPNLEVVVVEDGDDGITEAVAKGHGTKYIPFVRTESKPEFQSVSRVFNAGIAQATGTILILQAPETFHIGDVIRQMVEVVKDDPKKMALVETVILAEDGSRRVLGTSAGASPRALHKQTVLDIGRFEESFFGYGYEDDFFSFLLERNGVTTVGLTGISAAHQWHPSTEGGYEPFTGHANRARCWGMALAINWYDRPAKANIGPVVIDDISPLDIDGFVQQAYDKFSDIKYRQWAWNWRTGSRDDDATLEALNIASATIHQVQQKTPSYFATRAAEAAWASIWATRCAAEYSRVRFTDPVWAARVLICQQCHETLAQLSVLVMRRILNGEKLR
jgi:glycosyltransferase involved in cell wall biosynthesis